MESKFRRQFRQDLKVAGQRLPTQSSLSKGCGWRMAEASFRPIWIYCPVTPLFPPWSFGYKAN